MSARFCPVFLLSIFFCINVPPCPVSGWEKVGDTAMAEVSSLREFSVELESMMEAYSESISIKLPMKRDLGEYELQAILESIYRDNTSLQASVRRMEATIRYANGMNTVDVFFTYVEPAWKHEMFLQKVKEIAGDIIEPGMSEKDMAKAVHDFVIERVVYDETGSRFGPGEALEGRAVCQGYALLAAGLFDEAGLENMLVLGPDHAWNLVKVDGVWRHVDTVWDDPVIVGADGNKIYNAPDTETIYEAFLRTDDEMRALGHVWEKERYPEAR